MAQFCGHDTPGEMFQTQFGYHSIENIFIIAFGHVRKPWPYSAYHSSRHRNEGLCCSYEVETLNIPDTILKNEKYNEFEN